MSDKLSDKVSDYKVVVMRRGRGRGPVHNVQIVMADGTSEIVAEYRADDRGADDVLCDFIKRAQEEERHDPHNPKLPSDSAMIKAALRDLGVLPVECE